LRIRKATDREGVDDLAGLVNFAIGIDGDRAARLQRDGLATRTEHRQVIRSHQGAIGAHG
jgi:hypothetical protein